MVNIKIAIAERIRCRLNASKWSKKDISVPVPASALFNFQRL
jgi:hypothetical protein